MSFTCFHWHWTASRATEKRLQRKRRTCPRPCQVAETVVLLEIVRVHKSWWDRIPAHLRRAGCPQESNAVHVQRKLYRHTNHGAEEGQTALIGTALQDDRR